MMDDDQLGSRLRGQLDLELGDLRPQPGSRERLRRGMRKRRRSPWFRASVLVPVATALAIAALVLTIPALLHGDNEVKVTPAGPVPVSTSVDRTPTPVPTAAPRQSTIPKKATTSKRPRPTTRDSTPTRAERPTAQPTQTAKRTPARSKPEKSSALSATTTQDWTPDTMPTPSATGK